MHPILAQARIQYVNDTVTPIEIINLVIAYAIIAAFILSVAYVFYGGFRLIFSGGDETKVKAAMGTIRHAIIGLIITIFATTIISLVGNLIGLDVIGKILDFDTIVGNMRALIDRLTGQTGDALSNGAASSGGGNVQYNYSKDF